MITKIIRGENPSNQAFIFRSTITDESRACAGVCIDMHNDVLCPDGCILQRHECAEENTAAGLVLAMPGSRPVYKPIEEGEVSCRTCDQPSQSVCMDCEGHSEFVRS
jgi:hypothetical protein